MAGTQDPARTARLVGVAARVALGLVVLMSLAAAPFGVWLIRTDLAVRTEELDGVGLTLGIVLLTLVVLIGVPALTAVVWWRSRPRPARAFGYWAAGLLALVSLLGGAAQPSLLTGVVALVLLVLLVVSSRQAAAGPLPPGD